MNSNDSVWSGSALRRPASSNGANANAAVWMPAHINDAEQVQRTSVEAARKLERSQAAVTWKPRGTVKSKKPQCGANEGERHSRQSGTKPFGSRQSKSRGAMEQHFRGEGQDGPPEQSGGCRGRAPPKRRTRKTKKRPPECRLSRAPSSSGTDLILEVNGRQRASRCR